MRAQTTAEVSLVQLRSCLVNLPTSIAEILINANTAAQNVVVELQYLCSTEKHNSNSEQAQKSIYLGWTGLNSQRRQTASLNSNDGRNTVTGRGIGVVEIDSALARTVGLSNGQKVGVLLHVDPQPTHTVNIEPLTPADWEIIELHANFLETNLLAQVRALPNPNFVETTSSLRSHGHPLTLHLSPTSTANISITSLDSSLSTQVPFAKLAPDAEVIVAPKSRSRAGRSRAENRSVTGTSQRSTDDKSVATSSKDRNRSEVQRRAIFLRGLDDRLFPELVGPEGQVKEEKGLTIWIDQSVLSGRVLHGVEWVFVSVVHPTGIQLPIEPQQLQKIRDQETGDIGKHATRIVAKVKSGKQALDPEHALLNHLLCASLGMENMAGGIVRIEAAAAPTSTAAIRILKVFPFASSSTRKSEVLKFGGESRATREAAVERLKILYGSAKGNGLLDGAVTDGAILPRIDTDAKEGWEGGLIRFDPSPTLSESIKNPSRWFICQEQKIVLEVCHEVFNPFDLQRNSLFEQDPVPLSPNMLVGIDDLAEKLISSLRRQSSIILSGGLGSGKTSISRLLGHRMRQVYFYYVSYFDCRRLIADETRVGAIKDTMNKIFMRAAWGCKLGGKSLVILDNLDKLCPAETELLVGGENGRSRQLSELICSIVHQHCVIDSSIVMLATSLSKDTLNSVITGGHVVREIIGLKAPDKDKRRRILESFIKRPLDLSTDALVNDSNGSSEDEDWMDASTPDKKAPTADLKGSLVIDEDLDFLEIAGQTDGYMPGDLVLLLSRAKGEAIIRTVSKAIPSPVKRLNKADFARALEGFTPASLRNVTLQSSSVTFESIGGLSSTRDILLETLQYPTTYAPIFSQCPLRLRSGLLLYGYPGCGKTLLASAVAGECGLNFISVKGPEILNKYIGASEKSVRDLFERAEAARPCVLFFDEFDSIAPKRGHDSTGVTDRVVNQLLTQMDGAEGLSGVYVLAATSRPDLIDPALLRPGRLDKSLLCDMPSAQDRLDIMRALSRKLQVSSDVLGSVGSGKDLSEIANLTEGYSGADLQALIYNAHLEAIHDVLGDNKGGTQGHNSEKQVAKPSHRHALNQTGYLQFRFGKEEDSQESQEHTSFSSNQSKLFAERTELATKIDYLKLAKRREKAMRRGRFEHDSREMAVEGQEPAVVIEWKHLAASLASTRSSISVLERKKLETIYKEFVVGRNGEMPSGQGPKEIGARSSLM